MVKLNKITECGYECEAGPLEDNVEFSMLIDKVRLWVVVKNGQLIAHVSGNKGYRFTACTSREEAQWLADLYNRENYGNHPTCTVKHWLEI